MATLTVRNLDDDVKARLRVDAARHGRSMEEHARQLLGEALAEQPVRRAAPLGTWINSLVLHDADGNGVELKVPSRAGEFRPDPLA